MLKGVVIEDTKLAQGPAQEWEDFYNYTCRTGRRCQPQYERLRRTTSQV